MSEPILKSRARKLLFDKLFIKALYNEKSDLRVLWLNNLSVFAEDAGLDGAVAECGVFRGCFAYYINKYFESRKFYLFDTFAGFSRQDVEEEIVNDSGFEDSPFASENIFCASDEAFVLGKMPNPLQCIIKKGYFPDTAIDVDADEKFCFVNLDMDLYKPMFAGLQFFWPRLSGGGGDSAPRLFSS